MKINKEKIKELSESSNQIVLIEGVTSTTLDPERFKREELLQVDYFLEYATSSNEDFNTFYKRKIKAKIIDENNNLLLIVETEK